VLTGDRIFGHLEVLEWLTKSPVQDAEAKVAAKQAYLPDGGARSVRAWAGRRKAEVLVPGVLHDVVEDTEVTVLDLAVEFGPKVAAYVEWLTKPPVQDAEAKVAARRTWKVCTAPERDRGEARWFRQT
jgi:hypothetical protein